jgi:hypothetical protein
LLHEPPANLIRRHVAVGGTDARQVPTATRCGYRCRLDLKDEHVCSTTLFDPNAGTQPERLDDLIDDALLFIVGNTAPDRPAIIGDPHVNRAALVVGKRSESFKGAVGP